MKKALTYLFLALGFFSFGQKLTATFSQHQSLIGEPITLEYTVSTKVNDSLFFEPFSNEIETRLLDTSSTLTNEGINLEIYQSFHDTTIISGNQKKWIGKYVVIPWDSGMYLIPGQKISINDSLFQFKDLAIDVMFIQKQKGIDIFDIRENFTELPDEEFNFHKFFIKHWWWLIGGFLLLIGSAIFLWRKNKNNAEIALPEKKINLKDRTIMAIDALEAEKLWEKEKLKEHFIELSFIMRSYLTSRYNIPLLEKTTNQSRTLLLQQGLHEETVETIITILFQSDMVKFAKSKPDSMTILKQSALAKQIVAETSPLDFDAND